VPSPAGPSTSTARSSSKNEACSVRATSGSTTEPRTCWMSEPGRFLGKMRALGRADLGYLADAAAGAPGPTSVSGWPTTALSWPTEALSHSEAATFSLDSHVERVFRSGVVGGGPHLRGISVRLSPRCEIWLPAVPGPLLSGSRRTGQLRRPSVGVLRCSRGCHRGRSATRVRTGYRGRVRSRH
jgi:hypothetical protein